MSVAAPAFQTGGLETERAITRVGVLGGGQLGWMLALAGVPLGMRFTFFDPSPDAPAAVAGDHIVAGYDDTAALDRFCAAVDVVTYEFENVPVAAADYVAAHRPVWPPASTLNVAQDRVHEKECFRALAIPTAPFAAVDTLDELRHAVATIGAPGVLKTRRMGYDGKGQARIHTSTDVDAAWAEIGGVPLIYEGFVTFARELSVLAVRGQDGTVVVYPPVENHHSEGILRLSLAPAANVDVTTRATAERYATSLLNELGYVGVLAIELFDTPDGLVANEMAPRVHNSGHWTIEGAETSQFENHVRAVCGLPLGDVTLRGHSAMLNVIGEAPNRASILSTPGAHLHWYGKSAAPRRKLGHITVRGDDATTVRDRVTTLRRSLSTH